MMRSLRLELVISFLATLLFIASCQKDPLHALGSDKLMYRPLGFPAIIFPEGNEYTKERWQLGKKLFFDNALSKDSTLSCSTCHLPQFAFSDTVAFSKGVLGLDGTSNAPSLANVAYQPYYTRAGGVSTLEKQILVPIQEHNEFGFNLLQLVLRLQKDSSYQNASQRAYNREMDAYVMTRALANFERSFISGNSRFDQYEFQGRRKVLNEKEKRGMKLFFGDRTNCSSCHSGFNFTNYAFENNGLHQLYLDDGRMNITHLEKDKALFKVPSLRNISITAPYMHDGSLNTLQEVVAHYNKGGKDHQNKNHDLVKPLGLSQQEENELVAFLETLTDYEFITNKKFRNE